MLSPDQVASQGPGGFLNLNGGATDPYYARADGSSYPTFVAACDAVPAEARRNRTVTVAGKEYWWLEADLSDAGLVAKIAPAGTQLTANQKAALDAADSPTATNFYITKSGLIAKVDSYSVITAAGVYRVYQTVEAARDAAADADTLFVRGTLFGVVFPKNTRLETTGATLFDNIHIGQTSGTTPQTQETTGLRGNGILYLDAPNGSTANSRTIRNSDLLGRSGVVIGQKFAQAQGLTDVVTLTSFRLKSQQPSWGSQYPSTCIIAGNGTTSAGNRPVTITLDANTYLENTQAGGSLIGGSFPAGSKIIILPGATTIIPSGGTLQSATDTVKVDIGGGRTVDQTTSYTDAQLIVDLRTPSTLFLPNTSEPPTPVGGAVLYAQGGAVKSKGSNGTITIIGSA
jgi:hypothetical protein